MEGPEHHSQQSERAPIPEQGTPLAFRPEVADEILKQEISEMGGAGFNQEERLDIERRRLKKLNQRIESVLAQFDEYEENMLPKIIDYEPHRAFRESQAVVRTLHDRVQWSIRELENMEQGKGK